MRGRSITLTDLMGLVALAAFDLALLRGAWMLLAIPPVAVLIVALNLLLLHLLVRRRTPGWPVVGAIVVGIGFTVTMFGVRTRMVARLIGWFREPSGDFTPWRRLDAVAVEYAERVFTTALALILMAAVGLAIRRVGERVRSRPARVAGAPPVG